MGNTNSSNADRPDQPLFLDSIKPTTTNLMTLPPEIRDMIYAHLITKPSNVITMLSNHASFISEVSAQQPALSYVNRQIRHEVLPMYYGDNSFLAEVSDSRDLATAKRWLHAIGDENVGTLRRLTLCGWTRIPYGHMICRRWVRVVLDLKKGAMGIEEGGDVKDQSSEVSKSLRYLEEGYGRMMEARKGECLDVGCIASLMDRFHWMCTAF